MKVFEGKQTIKQLEKRKGGYYYLRLDSEVINQFPRKRATRMICTLDKKVTYRCGLNHLGDGHFFIIVASKYLKPLGKGLGESITFRIEEDPDQLGVPMPEVLKVFLAQEPSYRVVFEQLTDGKKRSLIYNTVKVKDIDRQVKNIMEFLEKEGRKMR